jgi:hypothetical protein
MGRPTALSSSRLTRARELITREVDADDEDLIRSYAGFVGEIKDLAGTAPDGSVLDVCEDAVIERGREHRRRLLQRAPQARLDAAEKKGRR